MNLVTRLMGKRGQDVTPQEIEVKIPEQYATGSYYLGKEVSTKQPVYVNNPPYSPKVFAIGGSYMEQNKYLLERINRHLSEAQPVIGIDIDHECAKVLARSQNNVLVIDGATLHSDYFLDWSFMNLHDSADATDSYTLHCKSLFTAQILRNIMPEITLTMEQFALCISAGMVAYTNPTASIQDVVDCLLDPIKRQTTLAAVPLEVQDYVLEHMFAIHELSALGDNPKYQSFFKCLSTLASNTALQSLFTNNLDRSEPQGFSPKVSRTALNLNELLDAGMSILITFSQQVSLTRQLCVLNYFANYADYYMRYRHDKRNTLHVMFRTPLQYFCYAEALGSICVQVRHHHATCTFAPSNLKDVPKPIREFLQHSGHVTFVFLGGVQKNEVLAYFSKLTKYEHEFLETLSAPHALIATPGCHSYYVFHADLDYTL